MATAIEEMQKTVTFQYQGRAVTGSELLRIAEDSDRITLQKAYIGYNTAVLAASVSDPTVVGIRLDMSWKEGLTVLIKNRDKIKEEHMKEGTYAGDFGFDDCKIMLSDYFSAKKKQELKAKAASVDHKEEVHASSTSAVPKKKF